MTDQPTMHLEVPEALFSMLRLESNYKDECPITWQALEAAPRQPKGRGKVIKAIVPCDDVWYLIEYLDSRCRVRAAYGGVRTAQREDGSWPGREGAWSERIYKQWTDQWPDIEDAWQAYVAEGCGND